MAYDVLATLARLHVQNKAHLGPAKWLLSPDWPWMAYEAYGAAALGLIMSPHGDLLEVDVAEV